MHSNFVPFGCCRLVDFTINFRLVVIHLFPGGWSIFVDGRLRPVVKIEILSLRLIGERHNPSGPSSVDRRGGTLLSIFVDGRHFPRRVGPVVKIEILSLRLIGERHNPSGSSSVDGRGGTLFSIFVDGGRGPLGLGPVVKIEILSLRLTDSDVGGREGTRCLLMFYGVSAPGYLSGVCLAEGISAGGTFRMGHIF